jgi:serine protease Do
VNGSIIDALDAGGPAATAGLRPGDVLSAVDGKWPGDSRAVMRSLVQAPVGKPVQLTAWRDGKPLTVTTTVAEWPNFMPNGGMINAHAAEAMIQRMPDPGVRLALLTDDARKQYGIDPKVSGVLVASVEKDCEARDLGILPGDVITAAQGAPVATPDDVRRAVQTAHDDHRPFLAILIQSKNSARWVSLSISPEGR